MPEPRKVELESVKRLLMTEDGVPGAIERAVGFRTSTNAIKVVHIMNDLAQCLLGGAPGHGGDFLCRVIRLDIDTEDHSEATMRTDARFGAVFDRAFPTSLGVDRIAELRRAARTVLNFDGGVYQPGTSMASPLATHRDLLGFEGFRRFGLGRYLEHVLTKPSAARLRELFKSDDDPITRAFAPLLISGELVDKGGGSAAIGSAGRPFDLSLGASLETLLGQPLSKPALLRCFALTASLGLVLKVLGAGRTDGRPRLLALPVQEEPKILREEAVASFRRAVDALDVVVADRIGEHPDASALLSARPRAKAECVDVAVDADGDERRALVRAARATKAAEHMVYWPDLFAVALGRKIGCVMPLSDRAGWGKHLALTSELVEALVLTRVPHGARAIPWRRLWAEVRDELGIVIGANPSADAQYLASAGVDNVSIERLSDNAEAFLTQAVRRGVARRLPDGGAEAGGELK